MVKVPKRKYPFEKSSLVKSPRIRHLILKFLKNHGNHQNSAREIQNSNSNSNIQNSAREIHNSNSNSNLAPTAAVGENLFIDLGDSISGEKKPKMTGSSTRIEWGGSQQLHPIELLSDELIADTAVDALTTLPKHNGFSVIDLPLQPFMNYFEVVCDPDRLSEYNRCHNEVSAALDQHQMVTMVNKAFYNQYRKQCNVIRSWALIAAEEKNRIGSLRRATKGHCPNIVYTRTWNEIDAGHFMMVPHAAGIFSEAQFFTRTTYMQRMFDRNEYAKLNATTDFYEYRTGIRSDLMMGFLIHNLFNEL